MKIIKKKYEYGKYHYTEFSKEEFLNSIFVSDCPICKKHSYEITPCLHIPFDHGHGICTQCNYTGGWISGANGYPFRG